METQTEKTSLLSPYRQHGLFTKSNLKKSTQRFADLVGTSAMVAGLYFNYGAGITCTNDETVKSCMATFDMESIYIALGFTAFHYVMHFISHDPRLSNSVKFMGLAQLMRHVRNLLGSHMFYFQMLSYFQVFVVGSGNTMAEDLLFWGLAGISAIVAVLTYSPLRYWIREKRLGIARDAERGKRMVAADVIAESLNGFNVGRQMVFDFENLVDGIFKTQTNPSVAGQWSRYGFGMFYGLVQGVLNLYYTPMTEAKTIFNTELPSVLQAALTSLTYCFNLIFRILKVPMPHFAIQVGIYGGLAVLTASVSLLRDKIWPQRADEPYSSDEDIKEAKEEVKEEIKSEAKEIKTENRFLINCLRYTLCCGMCKNETIKEKGEHQSLTA